MNGKRAWPRVAVPILLLAGLACGNGCQKNQSPSGKPSTKPPAVAAQPYSESFSARGWTYHLRPLTPEAKADEAKALEVWRDLFQGMAEDPKTQELLRRLHADRPVAFIVLDAKQGEDVALLTAAPPGENDFVMRAADTRHFEEKVEENVVHQRVVAYGHVALLKGATARTVSGFESIGDELKKAPSPGEPLDLAMQDYILRHAPGWISMGGPYFKDKKLPAGTEEQRRVLDKNIKAYADNAKAFYGGLPKR